MRLLSYPTHILCLSFLAFLATSRSFSQTKPSRILSNTLLSDEILHSMITDFDDKELDSRVLYFSEKSRDKRFSNIADKVKKPTVESNLESILKAKPDLVILASYNRIEFKHAVKSQNIPVLELDSFDSIESIIDNLKKIAIATHSLDSGKKMENFLREKILKIKHRAQTFQTISPINHQNVPTILSMDSYGYSMGEGTLWNDIVSLIGFKNWASSEKLKGWPKLQDESLLRAKFDYLVLSSESDPKLPWELHFNLWKEFFKKSPWTWILKRKELNPLANHILFAPEPLMYSCSQYALNLADFLLDSFSKNASSSTKVHPNTTSDKGTPL